ncbi:tripartite motif-containing protein 59 [Neosynchiropus ocellatus]
MEGLEENLTCPVCYSFYSDPRILPCMHNFCKNCLGGLLQALVNYSIWRPLRMPINCPLCRSLVELPIGGVDALPRNLPLRDIIEEYKSNCAPRTPTCQEHRRQPLNMYCFVDKQLICGLCLTVGQHQGHSVDDLHAAFLREKQRASFNTQSEKRWTQVCELAEQLQQEKIRCEELVRQDRQKVLQFFHSLEEELANKKHAYLDALDKATVKVLQTYEPLILQVKELQEEHGHLVSMCSELEEEDSPLIFLEKAHMFREREKEFTDAPLPSMVHLSVCLSPWAAECLQYNWNAAIAEIPLPNVSSGPRSPTTELEPEPEPEPEPEVEVAADDVGVQDVRLLVVGFLLLVAAVLWNYPAAGVRLCWLSQVGPALHALSGKVAASVWNVAEMLCEAAHAVVSPWVALVLTLGDNIHQQVGRVLHFVTSKFDMQLLKF